MYYNPVKGRLSKIFLIVIVSLTIQAADGHYLLSYESPIWQQPIFYIVASILLFITIVGIHRQQTCLRARSSELTVKRHGIRKT